MALRIRCQSVGLPPGNVMYPYWGANGFYRPQFEAYFVTGRSVIVRVVVRVDSGADNTLLSYRAGRMLGLQLPYPRAFGISGAGGTYTGTVSFPPDGLVSIFVTDYREFCYLPAPLIGFHAPPPSGTSQRSVLGIAGFLQYFRYTQEPSPPVVELDPAVTFVGTHGPYPRGRSLMDFIAGLRQGEPTR